MSVMVLVVARVGNSGVGGSKHWFWRMMKLNEVGKSEKKGMVEVRFLNEKGREEIDPPFHRGATRRRFCLCVLKKRSTAVYLQ